MVKIFLAKHICKILPVYIILFWIFNIFESEMQYSAEFSQHNLLKLHALNELMSAGLNLTVRKQGGCAKVIWATAETRVWISATRNCFFSSRVSSRPTKDFFFSNFLYFSHFSFLVPHKTLFLPTSSSLMQSSAKLTTNDLFLSLLTLCSWDPANLHRQGLIDWACSSNPAPKIQ